MPSISEGVGGWGRGGEMGECGRGFTEQGRVEGPRLKNQKKNKNKNTRTASPIYRGHGNSHRLAQDGCSCAEGAQCTVRESSDCGPNSKRPGEYLAVTFPGGVHRRARVKYSHTE